MKPLSILLDARKLGDGGIGIYIENLVDGLLEEKRGGYPLHLTLLCGPAPEIPNRFADDVTIIEERAKKYSFDEHARLGRRLNSLLREHDLFHSPHYTLPRGIRIPTVVTIHDTIHLLAPENPAQKIVGGYLLRSALRRATQVVTVSGVSLARLNRVVPGVPVTVIPNALARAIGPVPFPEVATVLGKFSLPQPYVLFVGSDRPHKGFDLLVDALSSCSEFSPSLVVVGERFSAKVRNRTEHLLGAGRVFFLGGVSRSDLVGLYNGARTVVVPSRIEGFGLVALEALACGAPLVCTPELSLKEVAANCAWYASDFTKSGLREAIVSCFTNRQIADEKAHAGVQRAAEFSIARSAEAHLRVYLDLLPVERAQQLMGLGLGKHEPISYLRQSIEVSPWGVAPNLPATTHTEQQLPLG